MAEAEAPVQTSVGVSGVYCPTIVFVGAKESEAGMKLEIEKSIEMRSDCWARVCGSVRVWWCSCEGGRVWFEFARVRSIGKQNQRQSFEFCTASGEFARFETFSPDCFVAASIRPIALPKRVEMEYIVLSPNNSFHLERALDDGESVHDEIVDDFARNPGS